MWVMLSAMYMFLHGVETETRELSHFNVDILREMHLQQIQIEITSCWQRNVL